VPLYPPGCLSGLEERSIPTRVPLRLRRKSIPTRVPLRCIRRSYTHQGASQVYKGVYTHQGASQVYIGWSIPTRVPQGVHCCICLPLSPVSLLASSPGPTGSNLSDTSQNSDIMDDYERILTIIDSLTRKAGLRRPMSLSYHPFHCWSTLFLPQLLLVSDSFEQKRRKEAAGSGGAGGGEKRCFLSFWSVSAPFRLPFGQNPLKPGG